MKFKRVLALALAAALMLSGIGAAAADENGGDVADGVLGMVEQLIVKDKLNVFLDVIEAYSLYEYAGDSEVLLDALAAFFAEHPELLVEFADDLFQTQDSYSHYMEPETYEQSYIMNDSFVGIGIELETANDGLVKVVYPNTPAEEAGMLAGDFIFSVNGEVIEEGSHYSVFQEKLRGEEGTEVTVGVRRGEQELEFTMVRRKVVLSNISVEDLGDGIAYVRIAHFGDDLSTFVDFVNAYEVLPEQGYTSVIFDVRNNNGGDSAVLSNILSYTLWEEDVAMFTERTRDGEPYIHRSLGQGWKPEKVCVLVNEYTASSAEIFAGVIGYVAGGTIIGESEYTHGKGIGQYVLEFTDGSLALITGAEAFIGEDISYNGVGIEADIVAPPVYTMQETELTELNPQREFYPNAKGEVVMAAEQRLGVLGFFAGTPDENADEETFAAINAFQEASGIRVQQVATTETLTALAAAVNETTVTTGYTVHDAALEAAVEFCGGTMGE